MIRTVGLLLAGFLFGVVAALGFVDWLERHDQEHWR